MTTSKALDKYIFMDPNELPTSAEIGYAITALEHYVNVYSRYKDGKSFDPAKLKYTITRRGGRYV